MGIYVHGSIAFGCFDWNKSDIDFIAVIGEPICVQTKSQLLQVLTELSTKATPKGLEMSLVLRKHCENFVHPTPYELHFSNSYTQDLIDEGVKTDWDLAAHFTVIKNVGIVLTGKRIDDVFGEVPRGAYLDSICKDIENAAKDVLDNPVYIILNLCRVYAYVKDGSVLSKEQGGKWGLKNLPKEYHGLITSMLNNYTYGKPIIKNPIMEISFCEHMLDLIFGPREQILDTFT